MSDECTAFDFSVPLISPLRNFASSSIPAFELQVCDPFLKLHGNMETRVCFTLTMSSTAYKLSKPAPILSQIPMTPFSLNRHPVNCIKIIYFGSATFCQKRIGAFARARLNISQNDNLLRGCLTFHCHRNSIFDSSSIVGHTLRYEQLKFCDNNV